MAREKPHKTATIWGTPPRVRKMPGVSLTRPPQLTTLPPPRSQTRSRMPQGHMARPGWIEVIAGVMFAGIDMDFRGLPFGPVPTLLAIAEVVDKLQAICVVCGEPASRNQRLVNGKPALWDSPTIMVGGRETYEARCRHCHRVPRQDEDQTALL